MKKRTGTNKQKIMSMILMTAMVVTLLPQSVTTVNAAELNANQTSEMQDKGEELISKAESVEEQEKEPEDEISNFAEEIMQEKADSSLTEDVVESDGSKVFEVETIEVGKEYEIHASKEDIYEYTFVAPESGYYQFSFTVTEGDFDFWGEDDYGNCSIRSYQITKLNNIYLKSFFLENQEKLYLTFALDNEYETKYETGAGKLLISKADSVEATFNDNSYTFSTDVADFEVNLLINVTEIHYEIHANVKEGVNKDDYVISAGVDSNFCFEHELSDKYMDGTDYNLDSDTEYPFYIMIFDKKDENKVLINGVVENGTVIRLKTRKKDNAEAGIIIPDDEIITRCFSADINYYCNIERYFRAYALYYKKRSAKNYQPYCYLSPNRITTSLDDLSADTDYDICVVDENENIILEKSFHTKSFDGTPTLSIEQPSLGNIKFNYDFTKASDEMDTPYSDNSYRAYYDIVDENGKSVLDFDGDGYGGFMCNFPFSSEILTGFECDKQYTVKTWLSDYNNVKYCEKEEQVTIPSNNLLASDNIAITPGKQTNDGKEREFLKISYGEYEKKSAPILYISDDFTKQVRKCELYDYDYSNKEYTYLGDEIIPGATYTYRVNLDGVEQMITHQYAAEKKYEPKITVKPGCFDALFECSMNPKNTLQEEEYEAEIVIYSKDSMQPCIKSDRIRLTRDNGYQGTTYIENRNVNDLYYNLVPGAEYVAKYSIYTGNDSVVFQDSIPFSTKEYKENAGKITVTPSYDSAKAVIEIPIQSEVTELVKPDAHKEIYLFIKNDNGKCKKRVYKLLSVINGKLCMESENDAAEIDELLADTEYTITCKLDPLGNGISLAETTFKTLPDPRTIVPEECEVMYGGIRVSAHITGADTQKNVPGVFFRKKNSSQWHHDAMIQVSDGKEKYYSNIYTDQYSPGDVLEYTISFRTTLEFEDDLEDGLREYDVREVTIPEEKREITVISTERNEGEINLNLKLGNLKDLNNKLLIYYRQKGSAEAWEVTSINLYNKAEVKTKCDISMFDKNSDIEYVMGIKKTNLGNGMHTLTCKKTGIFEAKEITKPQKLTLNKTKLYLNASGTGEGINYENLRASIMPADAEKDILWESTNEKVASVADGKVTAVGAGTATITATAKYNSELKAICEVTVRDYIVGKTDNGVVTEVTGQEFTLEKGRSIEGFDLYEKNQEGKLTAVSDSKVTVVKENLISYEATTKSLVAKNIGKTAVIFGKDEFKAAVIFNINAAGRNFGIKELVLPEADAERFAAYNAIRVGEKEYDLALVEGISYIARGAISPAQEFNPGDFKWTSADETIVKIDKGVLTPKNAGTTTVKVEPLAEGTDYKDSSITIKINVKELPVTGVPDVYASTNVHAKLKEINLDEAINQKGWTWDNPETNLYALPANSDAYSFAATYSGEKYFKYRSKVNVYLSTFKDVIITDSKVPLSEKSKKTSILVADNQDSVSLEVKPSYFGNIDGLSYTIDVPEVNGLTIKKSGDSYVVSTTTTGTYTVTANIKVAEQLIKSTTYIIKAVSGQQADKIELTSDNEAVKNQLKNDVLVKCDESLGSFILTATVTGRDGKEIQTPLIWTSTDKKVVTVTAEKNNSHNAFVSVKGNGHAVIAAKAKDETGLSYEINFEFRDHKPRMETKKITVNTAYDYKSEDGKNLAKAMYGTFEIAGVYGDAIENVAITKADGTASEFETVKCSTDGELENYLVKPKDEYTDIQKGTYKYRLAVKTTASDVPYTYDFTVNAVNKKPVATAKNASLNLFYIPECADMNITIDIPYYYKTPLMSWEDDNTGVGNEFEFGTLAYDSYNAKTKKTTFSAKISQEKINVSNKKVEKGVDTGKIVLNVPGVREPVVINGVKIRTNYKKASVRALNYYTGKTTSNIIPLASQTSARIYLFDTTSKSLLYCRNNKDERSYNNVVSDLHDINITTGDYLYQKDITYTGSKSSQKVALTLSSDNWREDITTTHTIKAVKPIVSLSPGTIVYNSLYMSEADVYFYYKNYYEKGVDSLDLVIQGADAKSKAIIADDRLSIFMKDSGLCVRLNDLSVMNETIPNGKYKYKVTPYIKDINGNKMKLNTLMLQVNLVNKPIAVNTKVQGTLDLVNLSSEMKVNSILTTPKFQNMGTSYEITKAELLGEYKNYFKLASPYSSYDTDKGIRYIKMNGYGKLKANQKYKLQIRYTVKTGDEEYAVVTSNDLIIKPKQSTPKMKWHNSNQTFYAATNGMYRMYTVCTPSDNYEIESVTGTLDYNKDGKTDAEATLDTVYGQYGAIKIAIKDKDALLAATNGKVHTLKITINLKGRDGVSKDVQTSVKLKVKR